MSEKIDHQGRPHAAVLGALLAAGFIAYGFNNVFMTVTPSFTQSVGGSLTQAGLQGTVFLFVAVALRFVLGPLADRIGPRPVMAVGVAAFAASAFLFVLCDAFWQILLVRCLQAVGIAAFFPCGTAVVSAIAPDGAAGRYLGVYRLVTSASLLCGPSVAFALVQTVGYGACFATMGALALGALALVLCLPRGVGAAAAHATDAGRSADVVGEKTAEDEGAAGGAGRVRRAGVVQTLRACFAADRRLCALMLTPTLIAALGYGLLYSFAATFVSSVDPQVNSGLFFTLMGCGGLVANPLAGWIADRAASRDFGRANSRGALLAGWMACFGAGVCLVGGFAAFGLPALVAAGVLAGAGYAGVITTVLAIVAARGDERLRSSLLSLQQNGVDLGIGCASGLFGLVFEALARVGVPSLWAFVVWGAATLLASGALVALARPAAGAPVSADAHDGRGCRR